MKMWLIKHVHPDLLTEEKKMKLEDVLKIVEYKMTGADKFLWNCYGPDTRVIDIANKDDDELGSFIINTKNEVLEVNLSYEYGKKPLFYRWIKPEFKQAVLDEAASRNVDMKFFIDDIVVVDLETETDCLEKMTALYNRLPVDETIEWDIKLETDLIEQIQKMADENKLSFNEQFNQILKIMVEHKSLLQPRPTKKTKSPKKK